MAMFPVLEVSGSAFERGRIHGEQALGRVEHSLANYARLFEFHGMPWAEAQHRSIAYRDVIGAFDASLLEEIEGIAQGAGRRVEEILALNARTELLPAQYLSGTDSGECTAMAVSPAAGAT
jgi:isopenicillin-N N-acyltransferase-like protein